MSGVARYVSLALLGLLSVGLSGCQKSGDGWSTDLSELSGYWRVVSHVRTSASPAEHIPHVPYLEFRDGYLREHSYMALGWVVHEEKAKIERNVLMLRAADQGNRDVWVAMGRIERSAEYLLLVNDYQARQVADRASGMDTYSGWQDDYETVWTLERVYVIPDSP
ncbi:MAG: hypothetical protein CSA97_01150 [Bacteroidetes bacterium]|nr:MAG: hypothetical protein CSA97_01150 [Bacteroidota bacterium]